MLFCACCKSLEYRIEKSENNNVYELDECKSYATPTQTEASNRLTTLKTLNG